jgi:hypothetical protein
MRKKPMRAREVGDSVYSLPPTPWALVFSFLVPGVPLRSTPGFTLSPAPQAGGISRRLCYSLFTFDFSSEPFPALSRILFPRLTIQIRSHA